MWRSIRWTVNIVVLAFAAYAFCVVPLGDRTGLEHARAILASDAAKDAKAEVVEAARKLDDKVRGGESGAGSTSPGPGKDAPPSTDTKSYDGPLPGAPLQRTAPALATPADPAPTEP